MAPGSIPTNATEIFQEGLRIPPLKFRDENRYNETLVSIIRQNVRIPDIVMGDLNAQLAACNVGARRIAELTEELGDNQILAIFDELLDRSEALTRAALRKIPNGTYRYVDFSDNDGIDLDKPIRFEVAVTVKDATFHCDFTGTSPQVRGPFNCVPSGSLAAACFALRTVTDPNIPTNAGCFRPITLSLPEGSVVNPREPAPVNSRTATIKRITGCILGALKDVLPDRVPADNAGEMLALMFGGRYRDGTAFVTGELIAGGSGAGPGSDGVDVIETDVTNCMNLPVEAMEMDAPIRVQQRGGLGLIKEYEILDGEVRFTYRGERHFHPPQGTRGGGEGAKAHAVIKRAAGGEEIIPSKQMATLWRGDRVMIETAGGAGYGPPSTRDPAMLALDIQDGKVTAGVAAARYEQA
jgi:N-methylhydantoinase B